MRRPRKKLSLAEERLERHEDLPLNRRTFSRYLLGSTAIGLTPASHGESYKEALEAFDSQRRFRIGVIADTHIIDPFYTGPEDSAEDTESMGHTTERLLAARKHINHLATPVEHVFHLGDVVHDSPTKGVSFYQQNRTRLDIAAELFAGFRAPVHLALGNHDYGLPQLSREETHLLFAQKLKTKPYCSLNYKGWKFVVLNNFLGASWDIRGAVYDQGVGTLGREQLEWLEAELRQRRPTIVLVHYPLWLIQDKEFADLGLHTLLRKYASSVQLVLSGHWHKWVDFAHTFGPQHYVVASTRYDPHAMMILELECGSARWRFANAHCIEWSTHFARAF
jgi:3',5'-cyclic AMP phosphodiesterase CpdA